jgi:hypothetical protein
MYKAEGNFQPAISEEQDELLRLEMMKYVRNGKLSKIGVKGMCRELLELKDENGDYIFYDIRYDKSHKGSLEALRFRAKRYRDNWKKYLLDDVKILLPEAIYAQADAAKKSPASLKAVMEAVKEPDDKPEDNRRALPPVFVGILRPGTVVTNIPFGQDGRIESVRDKGYECPNTGYFIPDGQQADSPAEVVPLGHDKPVHGVLQGADTAEGSAVSDTEVSSED